MCISILTLLNLVRAMLDSLGPTILGNPMQIIAFANNVVEEYVLQQEEKKLTEVSRAPEIATVSGLAGLASTTTVGEEGEGDDETQTLVLALSLVTVVLQGKSRFSQPGGNTLFRFCFWVITII